MQNETISVDENISSEKVLQNTPLRRWRPQVSLRTFLYLFTIFALVVALLTTSLRLWNLQRAYDTMRKDLRVLDITDPGLIHAVNLPVFEEGYVFRYRIYFPPNKNYVLKYALESIPSKGFVQPKNTAQIRADSIASGQSEILVRINSLDSRIEIKHPSGSSYASLPRSIVNINRIGSCDGVVGDKVAIQEPGKPVVLLRERNFYAQKQSLQFDEIQDPSETGYLIWIEEEK